MDILVIGLNHRTASVGLRERIGFSNEQAREATAQICSQGVLKELVILSTCNRTELYGVPNGHDDSVKAMEDFIMSYHRLQPQEVCTSFYRHTDRDAVRHIYRVASGLDSMMLGEAEILGQVREAYRRAFKQGATGRMLNRLFQSALEVGKHVRTDTGIGMHPMSVAFAGVKLAEGILTSLNDRRVLILGAGDTSEKVLRHLCDRGMKQIRIVNRTREHAEVLASRYGGEVVAWEDLRKTLEWPDLVVTSVSRRDPVLNREMLSRALRARKNRVLMMIDLGVPRNIAPGAGELPGVHLYNIDHLKEIVLQNLKAREQEIPRAEAIVEEHIENFARWQAGLSACAMLQDLRAGTQVDRDVFLRKHAEAMSRYSSEERAYVMELLKKFLNGSGRDRARNAEDDAEIWSRLQALSTLCSVLDQDVRNRG
jgi:glutamyl-tRNA reductase